MQFPPTGSFLGHMLPGVLFIVWAGAWVVGLIGRRYSDGPQAMEVYALVRGGKILLPLSGILAELAMDGGWMVGAGLNNFQHATMYAGFSLSGVFDWLEARGRLDAGATHVAFAVACAISGLLFAVHPAHGDMPAAMHAFLVLIFFALGAVALWEASGSGAADGVWIRTGLMILLGTWFIQIAYSIYVVGIDPTDTLGRGRAHLLLAWHVLAITTGMLALRSLRRGRRA